MLNIFIASSFIVLASLIGVISVWKKLGLIIEKNLHYLVSFSAGVFTYISYELIHESVEHFPTISSAFSWIFVGAILILIIFKILPDFHHHHDNDNHSHNTIDARKIVLSDSIHNIGDGLLIASAFSINIGLGIATTVSVFIHEIIQEISEFFVLKQSGYSTKKSLIINFCASLTIYIGAFIGYFLLEKFEMIEAPLIGITAGSFLIVVLHDLLPHSISKMENKKHILNHALWFIAGLVLILLAGTIMPHGY